MASKSEYLKSKATDIILEIISISGVHSFIYFLNGIELKGMFARLLVIINKANCLFDYALSFQYASQFQLQCIFVIQL